MFSLPKSSFGEHKRQNKAVDESPRAWATLWGHVEAIFRDRALFFQKTRQRFTRLSWRNLSSFRNNNSAVGNSLAFLTNLPFHEFPKHFNHRSWFQISGNLWKGGFVKNANELPTAAITTKMLGQLYARRHRSGDGQTKIFENRKHFGPSFWALSQAVPEIPDSRFIGFASKPAVGN